MVVRSGVSSLTELADAIRRTADERTGRPPTPPNPARVDRAHADRAHADWAPVDRTFRDWADARGRRADLRAYLGALPPDEAAGVVGRSKEATTHFAWCLLDRERDPFSLWLHEYKPIRDWLPGYANSVHNHRYHFSTTLLAGSYTHERFDADLDTERTAIRAVTRTRDTVCREGVGDYLLSHEFHRIPHSDDGTMTFLVKSRMVAPWSLSFDPATGLSRRHIPMGRRLAGLAGRM